MTIPSAAGMGARRPPKYTPVSASSQYHTPGRIGRPQPPKTDSTQGRGKSTEVSGFSGDDAAAGERDGGQPAGDLRCALVLHHRLLKHPCRRARRPAPPTASGSPPPPP
eukprot:1065286-Prorocentrum_minimum.AAC.2